MGLSAALAEAGECGCVSVESIATKSYDELECLYRSLSASELPAGYYRGTVLARRFPLPRGLSSSATRLVWEGKYIRPEQGQMLNRAFGHACVPASLGLGESWLDGCPSVLFDYACSSAAFARKARDEVRMISPGVYLGIMYVRREGDCPKLSTFFLLERRCCP
jgi:hypothetical protein